MRVGRNIDANNDFGNNVKYCLKQRGMSLRRLSMEINIPYQTIHRWVSGKTSPTLDKIYLIADALQTTVVDLLDPNMQQKGKEQKATTDTPYNYQSLYRDLFGEDATLPENYVAVISTALSNILTDTEREIIISRYGLDGNAPRTFSDVAKERGITRQRVNQIIDRSFQKLRFSYQTFCRIETELKNEKAPDINDQNYDWAKNVPILELQGYLSTHTINALMRNGLSSLYDIFQKTDYELSQINGIGKDAVLEIQKMRCTLQSYEDYINRVS